MFTTCFVRGLETCRRQRGGPQPTDLRVSLTGHRPQAACELPFTVFGYLGWYWYNRTFFANRTCGRRPPLLREGTRLVATSSRSEITIRFRKERSLRPCLLTQTMARTFVNGSRHQLQGWIWSTRSECSEINSGCRNNSQNYQTRVRSRLLIAADQTYCGKRIAEHTCHQLAADRTGSVT